MMVGMNRISLCRIFLLMFQVRMGMNNDPAVRQDVRMGENSPVDI